MEPLQYSSGRGTLQLPEQLPAGLLLEVLEFLQVTLPRLQHSWRSLQHLLGCLAAHHAYPTHHSYPCMKRVHRLQLLGQAMQVVLKVLGGCWRKPAVSCTHMQTARGPASCPALPPCFQTTFTVQASRASHLLPHLLNHVCSSMLYWCATGLPHCCTLDAGHAAPPPHLQQLPACRHQPT